jgi:hypothetical protein
MNTKKKRTFNTHNHSTIIILKVIEYFHNIINNIGGVRIFNYLVKHHIFLYSFVVI